MKKQPTATATVKEMRALANKAEDAATRAENAVNQATAQCLQLTRKIETNLHLLDASREHATRAQNAHNNAAAHARITEHAAEDAATYAGAARICLLLTVIFNAIFAVIFYAIR